MARIELHDVRKRFGAVEVLHGIDLVIPDCELTVLLGPSGCGKSTLLRLIAGIEEISAGDITIDGVRVNDLPPKQRGCAMVFQNYALYPHKRVADNIAFPLLMARVDRASREKRVREAARLLQLESYLDRLPRDLSGGQRQRVAMGRAIVREPKAFLFDEPLSNLDAELRVRMRLEIARLQRQLAATMLFVTHDQVEAMTLAHSIVVMRDGRVEQQGTPREVYRRPANVFVARFVGTPAMNLLPVEAVAGEGGASRLTLAGGHRLDLPFPLPAPPARVGIRSEHVRLCTDGRPGRLRFERVESVGVEHLGDRSYRYLQTPLGELVVLQSADAEPPPAGTLEVDLDLDELHLFDAAGDAIARPATPSG